MEITLTGFNSVLSNIQTNNRDCIELEDVDDKTYHKTLNEVGISLFPMSSLSSTVTCLHDLLDVMNALGYTVVNGEMFWASWWDEKTECGVYPGHIVINWLWQLLVSETRTLYHRLELIQKIPDNFKPAFAEVLDSRNADGLPITDHFTIDRPEEEILAVLEELKNAEWESHKVIKKGLVGDITKEEWLFVTTGKGEPLTRKLPWKLKYACKAFVQQYLKQDYKTAEKVFCIDDGRDDNRKDIVDLRGANNNKRSDICNSKTGTIAKCIRKAKGCLDTAVPLCPKIH
jgi:hypothetical protein